MSKINNKISFYRTSLLTILSVFFMASVGYSQQLGIYWENDGTWAKPNDPQDRHYTNGNRIDLAWNIKNDNFDDFCSNITGRDLSDDSNGKMNTNFGVFIQQHMQTPDHIAKPDLRADTEMRYACLLYGGPFIQIADNNVYDYFGLGMGVLGPSAKGKFTQDTIHDMRGFRKAVDWDTQLEDRLALDTSWIKKVRFCDPQNANLDFIGESFVTAGTIHRHAGLGITARYGTKLPKDFGPANINNPAYYYVNNSDSYFYGFVKLAGRYVEYNQFLDGLEKKDFLGETQVGITFAVSRLEITYSQVVMTKEYKDQNGNDSYGSFVCKLKF